MPEHFDIASLGLPPDDEVRALMARFRDIEPVLFRDQELLIRAGEPSQHVYLLLKGSCLVEHAGASEERQPGNELAIIEAQPGAPVFLGEMAYLGELSGGASLRSASVRSAMTSWALRLQPAHLDAIIERFPHFTRILCAQFVKRLRETVQALGGIRERDRMDSEQVFLEAGARLCAAGAPARQLYQLVDGVLAGAAEDVVELRADPAGRVFVEPEAYFRGGVWSRDWTAKTPCIVVAIDEGSKTAAVRNFPGLALSLLSA